MVPELENEIRVIGNRYRLHVLGIIKGRDMSRAATVDRDKTIAQLKERIAALQAERIAVLQSELRMSNAAV